MDEFKKNAYLKKAKTGDAEAMYLLAQEYENEGNLNDAFFWHLKAAMQGYTAGINSIAMYYLEGWAVDQDVDKAINLLESIADKLLTAKINLACIYLGGNGCRRDSRKGMELFRQAADSGDALAAFTMAKIYLEGQHRVPIDYKKATQWFEKAYALGIHESVDILCDLYEGKYSRKVKDDKKYKLWSDVKKNISGYGFNLSLQRFPDLKVITEDGSEVPLIKEADGRQYIIVNYGKLYIDFLIARTFVPNPYPDIYTEVEHIDGDMSNNALKNLRWVEKK